MKNKYQLAMAICSIATFAPFTAWAQPSVADPGAPVPPVVYRSVFTESPAGVETRSDDWKKANDAVAQFKRGHVDILKWEDAQTGDKAAPPPAPHKHGTRP